MRLGETAQWIDLYSPERLIDDGQAATLVRSLQAELLFVGCSLNQAEWPLVRGCKRSGIKTTIIVDIGAEEKVDRVAPADFPDLFLVTNRG